MSSSEYKLREDVEMNFLDKWKDEGYFERRPHELGGKRVLEKTFDEEFLTQRNIKTEKYKVGGIAVALKEAFGESLKDATHIRIRGGRILPITRADKRVVLSETPGKGIVDISPHEVVRIELLGATKDRIPIVDVPLSSFVKGEYKKRSINIKGTTRISVGTRMPRGRDFWSEIYSEVKDSLLNESEATDYRKQDLRKATFEPDDWWSKRGEAPDEYWTWESKVETSESGMIERAGEE